MKSTCSASRGLMSQATTSVGSLLFSVLASSHHALHMLILILVGGSTTSINPMSSLLWVRRIMIIVTLITVVITITRAYKHRHMPLWVKALSVCSILLSLAFVVYTLATFGW